MISTSNFKTMPPKIQGYVVGRYGGKKDEPNVPKTNIYRQGTDESLMFIDGWREGQKVKRECGE